MNIIQINEENEIKYLLNKYNKRYIKPLFENEINKLAKKFADNAIIYKVIEKDTDLGYIAFYANNIKDKIAFISQICVSENSTNRGIGRLLIDKCIEECKKKKFLLIQLSVYKQNESAINFYKKMGFYLKEDNKQSIKMEKKINLI